jgi:deoxyribonuclease V
VEIAHLHRWDLDTKAARALQESLASRVDVSRSLGPWETVAAADVSYSKQSDRLYAAVVVVRAGSLELIERACVIGSAAFPYVPGLLSFRELPPVLEAFGQLATVPDVVLCDGQGFAHPRRFGLACHLGLWLDLPTIGCAKSRLLGTYDEPGPQRGDRSRLLDGDEVIGAVVRTRTRVKPLYVSAGHRCDLEAAVAVTLATAVSYRLPVPARMAHVHVNELRQAERV